VRKELLLLFQFCHSFLSSLARLIKLSPFYHPISLDIERERHLDKKG
jgi:hypothetical protein